MLYQIPTHLSFALRGKTKRKTKKDQTKVKPQTKRMVWAIQTYFSMDPNNAQKWEIWKMEEWYQGNKQSMNTWSQNAKWTSSQVKIKNVPWW